MRDRLSRYAARKLWESIDALPTIVYGPSIRTIFWREVLRMVMRKA